MARALRYIVAGVLGMLGTVAAGAQLVIWNDAGAAVATLAGAALVAALIAPEK